MSAGMVVNGFINVVITTIERRFGLRSRETGMIAGGYDVASFLCLVPVSYLGGRPGASKPRWLGWGIVIMGVGWVPSAYAHQIRDDHPKCTHPLLTAYSPVPIRRTQNRFRPNPICRSRAPSDCACVFAHPSQFLRARSNSAIAPSGVILATRACWVLEWMVHSSFYMLPETTSISHIFWSKKPRFYGIYTVTPHPPQISTSLMSRRLY